MIIEYTVRHRKTNDTIVLCGNFPNVERLMRMYQPNSIEDAHGWDILQHTIKILKEN